MNKGTIYRKRNLTPAKKKFAQVYAQSDNGTQAVKEAYKESNLTNGSARVKAHRLLTDDNVLMEIEVQKAKMEENASKAVLKIGQLIESEDESIAGANSRWAYEQVHGKATQQIKSTSVSTMIVMDLTGGALGQPPQEILDLVAE